MKITVSTPIEDTPRVLQCAGMFDIQIRHHAEQSWDVNFPLDEKKWNIGLIVGPSGCGKSTIARELFGNDTWQHDIPNWPEGKAVVDGFPTPIPIKEVTELLSSVGFSSPPAWLKPYYVLSTGQQFRADLARLMAYGPSPADGSHGAIICDEFTSVVDRQVAQIGSAAVAKAIRKRNLKFVAVTCHYDVIPWLNPDWVYRPDENRFEWRFLQRRPEVRADIIRVKASAWPLFAPHHYLSHSHNQSATCFLATISQQPAAYSSWLPFVGRGPKTRREHRTVALPDFQGVGLGMAVSDTIASMWKALGYRATSTTTHPAFTAARKRSNNWRMSRAPGINGARDILKHATTRATAGFEYIGPPMEFTAATRLLSERL